MTSPTHSPAAQPHAAAKAGAACPSRAAPATIPDDIRRAATECADWIACHQTLGVTFREACEEEIARALMAERQKATDGWMLIADVPLPKHRVEVFFPAIGKRMHEEAHTGYLSGAFIGPGWHRKPTHWRECRPFPSASRSKPEGKGE